MRKGHSIPNKKIIAQNTRFTYYHAPKNIYRGRTTLLKLKNDKSWIYNIERVKKIGKATSPKIKEVLKRWGIPEDQYWRRTKQWKEQKNASCASGHFTKRTR